MIHAGFPKVSVVIPTINEAANLPHVLPKIPQWIHEVVLVDGHSTDGTVESARRLWPNHHVVTQEKRRRLQERQVLSNDRRGEGMVLRLIAEERRGKGAALQAGFAAATGDIITTLDADGSADPREIAAFVGALLSGAHYVKGSRFLQGGGTKDMPYYRRWGNNLFVALANALFGARFSDLCYGYNAFWAWVPPLLQLNGDGFEIETMMNVRALQARLKVAEVPSFEYLRVNGSSNLRTIPDGWRVLKTIWHEWARPTVRPPAVKSIWTPQEGLRMVGTADHGPDVHEGTVMLPHGTFEP